MSRRQVAVTFSQVVKFRHYSNFLKFGLNLFQIANVESCSFCNHFTQLLHTQMVFRLVAESQSYYVIRIHLQMHSTNQRIKSFRASLIDIITLTLSSSSW